MKKTYSELIRLRTFEDRLEYLYIGDKIGNETFGNSRWINQKLYKSSEWRTSRNGIILRDEGNDLAVDGCGLSIRNAIVHHINPITKDDILYRRSCVFDPDNLILVSLTSHNYIHYGIKQIGRPIERSPNDTCPWKNRR